MTTRDDTADDFLFTNVLGSPASELVRNSCLCHAADDRQAALQVIRVLRMVEMETGGHRSSDLHFCRQDLFVLVNKSHPAKSTVSAHPCKSRLCPGCSRWRIGVQVTRRLECLRGLHEKDYELFDLTLTHQDRPGESCREAWERLHDEITRRVRLPMFRRVVLGWMLRIEVTWRPGGRFHVHAHGVVVAVAGTTPDDAKTLWQGATGAKVFPRMSARPLPPSSVGNWLLYMAKPMKLPGRGLVEFMRDMPTGHAVIAGGVLHSKFFPKDPALPKTDDLRHDPVPLPLIKEWAEAGDELALAILEGIRPRLRRMGITDESKAVGSNGGPSPARDHHANSPGKPGRAGALASRSTSSAGSWPSKRRRRTSK